MKKYEVTSQIGSHSWCPIIECDHFSYGDSGVYYFYNSKTREEWWFPVMHTIVKKIITQ